MVTIVMKENKPWFHILSYNVLQNIHELVSQKVKIFGQTLRQTVGHTDKFMRFIDLSPLSPIIYKI